MHVEQSIDDRLHALVVLVRRERLEVPSDEFPRLDRPNDLPPVHVWFVNKDGHWHRMKTHATHPSVDDDSMLARLQLQLP